MLNKVAYGYPAELIGEIIFKNIPIQYEGYIDEYSNELKFNLKFGKTVVSGLSEIGDYYDYDGRVPFDGSDLFKLYRIIHEDIVKKTAKKHDINLLQYRDTTSEYFFSKDGKIVGPGFTSDEHMFTAVCKQCGEENPYKHYDPDYVCKGCQMMADWAKSAKNKSNIINKLANLYFLKSLAMDVEQARQILGLPPNASKADIMFAYKKQMHKLYMQTGQYQKVPVLDEARDSLMQEPAVTTTKPVETENESEELQENDSSSGIVERVFSDIKSKYSDLLENVYMKSSLGDVTYNINEMIRMISDAVSNNINFWAKIKIVDNNISIAEATSRAKNNMFMIGARDLVTFDDFKKFLELFKHTDKTDDMDDDLIDYLNSYVDDVFAKGYSDSVNRLEGVVNRHNLPSSILGRILLGYMKMSVPSSKIPVSLAKKMAAHQNASRHILSQLETHEHQAVREQVARNKNATFYILHRLKDDPDFHVRLAVAANPNTINGILHRLKDDPNPGISSLAKGRLGIP